MVDLATVTAFSLASIVIVLAPGPDTFYILGRGIGQGRGAAVVSVLGGGAGRLIHTLAAAFGLSALLLTSALAFEVVKYIGAAYLLYLGARTLLAKDHDQRLFHTQQASRRTIFFQGLTTNMLNPKVALFFLAFLPQFVHPGLGAVVIQFILLGCVFNAMGTLWSFVLAFFSGSVGRWLKRRPKYLKRQKWLTGGVFIALGCHAALMRHR